MKNEMIKSVDKSGEFSEPFFSVTLTTYNRADLLKRALDSLMAQTEKNWEAIIIDDGSTDDTRSLIDPYLRNGSMIRYVYQKNAGYAMAKNTGIFLSKGKFITFLDSDDEYLPNHLESRKAILMNYPLTDFLYGGVIVTGNQFVPDRFNYDKMIPLSECVIGGTFFIRREVAVTLNGFADTPMGSDADFFERVNKTKAVIRETDIPTYLYHRENENSVTNNLMRKENFLQ
ncbi:MAG: glycosyltransferase family A protein [Ginsengibacter sp.]